MRKQWLLPLVLTSFLSLFTGMQPCAETIYGAPGIDDEIVIEEEMLLPGAFDVRDEGKKTVIRSQGNMGTCWALTACSAMEAALMPEKQVEFSADHISLSNRFNISQREGGDYKMLMAYLSSWQGPVYEWQDPYGDGLTDKTLEPVAHVQEIRMYTKTTTEEIKKLLCTYGAVQTSLYMDRAMARGDTQYYKEETSSFYCSSEHEVNHDVLLLGWDDDYSRENFSEQPSEDGAWICQNTWGTKFGDDGIFYVSYEDMNVAKRALVYSGIEDTDNYDRIYQTDDCGWQGAAGYSGTGTCYMANVYTADSEQMLRAAGFYSTGKDTDYEVYVVHEFEDGGSFEKMVKAGEGHIDAKGYFTVPVDDSICLKEGERFAVVVRITTKNREKPVAVEMRKDVYTQGVTLEGKEGYISKDGSKWENIETLYKANVCLKVFTELNETEDTSEDES